MAISFLYTLPATARPAYTFILAGTRRGLSSRQIEDSIRAAGLSISRGRTIVPLMRELRKIEAQGAALRFIGLDKVVNVERLPEALTPIRRKYSFSVRTHEAIAGIEQSERFVTVATDRSTLRRGEIEDLAREAVDARAERYDYELTETTLVGGVQRFTGV